MHMILLLLLQLQIIKPLSSAWSCIHSSFPFHEFYIQNRRCKFSDMHQGHAPQKCAYQILCFNFYTCNICNIYIVCDSYHGMDYCFVQVTPWLANIFESLRTTKKIPHKVPAMDMCHILLFFLFIIKARYNIYI
jgi:hypothetical protein